MYRLERVGSAEASAFAGDGAPDDDEEYTNRQLYHYDDHDHHDRYRRGAYHESHHVMDDYNHQDYHHLYDDDPEAYRDPYAMDHEDNDHYREIGDGADSRGPELVGLEEKRHLGTGDGVPLEGHPAGDPEKAFEVK